MTTTVTIIGAGLGGQFDGEFGAFGLGQRLHHGHRRRAGCDGPALQHAGAKAVASRVLHQTAGQPAGAVAKHEVLAGADPPHGGGVETFVARHDRQCADIGQFVDVEQRGHHAQAPDLEILSSAR